MDRYWNDELYHYGVIGMKWGVRKAAGHTRKEIRADNKTAFGLGKEGTVSARAHTLAKNRVSKLSNKISKSESKGKDTSKLNKKLTVAKSVERTLSKESRQAKSAMDSHRNALIQKYGSEHISDIKTDKKGRVNEKVMTGKDFVKAVAFTTVSKTIAASIGSPIAIGMRPVGKTEASVRRYNSRYLAAHKKYKGKR